MLFTRRVDVVYNGTFEQSKLLGQYSLSLVERLSLLGGFYCS